MISIRMQPDGGAVVTEDGRGLVSVPAGQDLSTVARELAAFGRHVEIVWEFLPDSVSFQDSTRTS